MTASLQRKIHTMTILLGAHVGAGAKGINHEIISHGAEIAQIFLGSPMSWKPPKHLPLNENARPNWVAPIFIHCSYLVNPASSNPQVRARSIISLNQQLEIASLVGAQGLVVHGGHNSGGSVKQAIEHWEEALESLNFRAPLLIENTAGGSAAPARHLNDLEALWKVAGKHESVGLCIDTCHAHAGGMETRGMGKRIMEITGRIDLIHANGSRDVPGSGRDKHTNLFDSDIPMDDMIELIRTADSPVILETPGGLHAQLTELRMLRERLGLPGSEGLQIASNGA